MRTPGFSRTRFQFVRPYFAETYYSQFAAALSKLRGFGLIMTGYAYVNRILR